MITRVLVTTIKIYQRLISPIIGSNCRFYPTCSAYSIEALNKFGAFKGSMLSIVRIFRCGPWSSGGLDPVPSEITHSK